MDKLIYLFVYFVDRVRSLVGLVIPIFAEAADFRSWALWVKVLVHCILLGLILIGLYLLNSYPPLQALLKVNANKTVQDFYLPLVFILLYLLSWLAYFFWKLLSRGEAAEYEDVYTAWNEAAGKLRSAGINLGDAPLYLVVGRPVAGDDALFLASQAKITVRAPSASDAPIRVFAGPDAIYVCCSGASTWGKFADALASGEGFAAVGGGAGQTAAGATIDPSKVLGFVDKDAQEEFSYLLKVQGQRPLTPDEEARLRELGEMINQQSRTLVRRVSLPADDLASGPKRLAYLCRLIKQDRRPWCPLNGVLVLFPWAALDSDEICREAVPVLATDLTAARKTFQQRYPHVVMVCDLEDATGFEEFRRGFPKDMLKQRIGQRLPLVPDRPPAEVPGVLAQAADGIRQSVISSWVLKFLRLDPPDQRKTGHFVPSYNRRLFMFLQEIYVRAPRIGRLLSRGLPAGAGGSEPATWDQADALPLCAGCYLAATGRDEKRQAFVAGVFQRLTEVQSSVSWSESATAEDRKFRGYTMTAFTAAAVIALAGGLLAAKQLNVF